MRSIYKNNLAKHSQGGVVKYKPVHQSSFRKTAIKAVKTFGVVLGITAFFAAYAVFGKPKLAAGATPSEKPWPSISVSDTIKNGANAIYANLSLQSRQLFTNLCNQVNSSGAIPTGYFFPEKLALQAIAKWGRNFLENPRGTLEALEDAEKCARVTQNRSDIDRVAYMHAAAQLQFFRELCGALPEQQKRLLGEAFKMYVVPAAEGKDPF